MPLFEISPNILEMDSTRKRNHDEYAGRAGEMLGHGGTKDPLSLPLTMDCAATGLPTAPQIFRETPPCQSSPASLTDAGSSTPVPDSPSPNLTPTRHLQHSNKQSDGPTVATADSEGLLPPDSVQGAKRKRRTAAEIAAEEKERAIKKQKREEDKLEKDRKKADEKAQKEARQQERQAERAEKEAEKQAKAQEREEKRRVKEEQERKVQELKDKKERSQLKLGAFFKAPSTPKKQVLDLEIKTEIPQETSPSRVTQPIPVDNISEYDKLFKPFFVKEHVHLAHASGMDEETKSAKSKILDQFISGSRVVESVSRLDPVAAFQLPSKPKPRGRLHVPVKHTMDRQSVLLGRTENSSAESQRRILMETRRDLAKVPIKIISFSQDVRPPYRGTLTLRPYLATERKMRRLARKPTAPILALDYGYDSEAEWQDDEGEDLDAADDEEEELDSEDGMDEFLDDSEDQGPARRVFSNAMEPDSTGLCWENQKRLGPLLKMRTHRMEFMLENMNDYCGIDPFSTQYWEPAATNTRSLKTHGSDPFSSTYAADSKVVPSSLMPPPPTPSNAFEALAGAKVGVKDETSGPIKLVPDEDMPKFKRLVLEHQKLSKLGLTDLLAHSFEHVTKKQVENTLKLVAEKLGKRGVWELRKGYEL